MKRSSL